MRLVYLGEFGPSRTERPAPVRRALRRRLQPLAGHCRKVVAWLLPMVDPVFGPGWRCTLHGFTREGELVPVTVAGFDPGATTREAVERLEQAIEVRTGQPVRPVVTTALAQPEAPVVAFDGKPRRPRRRAA